MKYKPPRHGRIHSPRARKYGSFDNLYGEDWERLLATYGYACLFCGESGGLVPDHVISLSVGGDNDISNIQPLCTTCNARKGTKTTDYRPAFWQGYFKGEEEAKKRWSDDLARIVDAMRKSGT